MQNELSSGSVWELSLLRTTKLMLVTVSTQFTLLVCKDIGIRKFWHKFDTSNKKTLLKNSTSLLIWKKVFLKKIIECCSCRLEFKYCTSSWIIQKSNVKLFLNNSYSYQIIWYRKRLHPRTSVPIVKVNSTYMKHKVWPGQPYCIS